MRTCNRKRWIVSLAMLMIVGFSSAAAAEEGDAPSEARLKTTGEEAGVPLGSLAKLLKIESSDDDLTRARKERYNAAVSQFMSQQEMYRQGIKPLDSILQSLERLAKSAEPVLTHEAYLGLLTNGLKVARSLEEAAKTRMEEGFAPIAALHEAQFIRADLEIRLLEAKQAGKK